jgi:hypothetical protein
MTTIIDTQLDVSVIRNVAEAEAEKERLERELLTVFDERPAGFGEKLVMALKQLESLIPRLVSAAANKKLFADYARAYSRIYQQQKIVPRLQELRAAYNALGEQLKGLEAFSSSSGGMQSLAASERSLANAYGTEAVTTVREQIEQKIDSLLEKSA